jgi:hypothetical protein
MSCYSRAKITIKNEIHSSAATIFHSCSVFGEKDKAASQQNPFANWRLKVKEPTIAAVGLREISTSSTA